jgi:hypothetical protein
VLLVIQSSVAHCQKRVFDSAQGGEAPQSPFFSIPECSHGGIEPIGIKSPLADKALRSVFFDNTYAPSDRPER